MTVSLGHVSDSASAGQQQVASNKRASSKLPSPSINYSRQLVPEFFFAQLTIKFRILFNDVLLATFYALMPLEIRHDVHEFGSCAAISTGLGLIGR